MTRAASRQNPTRIQRAKTEAILAAALDVFSTHGFRGATLDQLAEAAGLSKPNLLYYFASKDDVHRMLLERLLDTWLDAAAPARPGRRPAGRDRRLHPRASWRWRATIPRESRLFAGEMLQGAPHIADVLARPAARRWSTRRPRVIRAWARGGPHRAGRPAPPDLLDLGRHPALRRLRRAGPRRARLRRRRAASRDAARFLTGLYARGAGALIIGIRAILRTSGKLVRIRAGATSRPRLAVDEK